MRSVQTAQSDKNESEGSNSNMIKRPAPTHKCTYVRLTRHATCACQTVFLSGVRAVAVEAAQCKVTNNCTQWVLQT